MNACNANQSWKGRSARQLAAHQVHSDNSITPVTQQQQRKYQQNDQHNKHIMTSTLKTPEAEAATNIWGCCCCVWQREVPRRNRPSVELRERQAETAGYREQRKGTKNY